MEQTGKLRKLTDDIFSILYTWSFVHLSWHYKDVICQIHTCLLLSKDILSRLQKMKLVTQPTKR